MTGEGEGRRIDKLGRIQVTPGCLDDPERKQYGCWWRGLSGKEGDSPPGRTLDSGIRGRGWSRINMQQ